MKTLNGNYCYDLISDILRHVEVGTYCEVEIAFGGFLLQRDVESIMQQMIKRGIQRDG